MKPTKKQILEGNKSLAEFLGYEIEKTLTNFKVYPIRIPNPMNLNDNPIEFLGPKELKFHRDWNHLMLVVEHINQLDDFKFRVYISKEFCSVRNELKNYIICSQSITPTILSVWVTLMEFIKIYKEWYSQNNKVQ